MTDSCGMARWNIDIPWLKLQEGTSGGRIMMVEGDGTFADG